ncbi:MAG TPA: hypothetical protein PK055_05520 [Gammaproteobacteria bacterium]|nr:hypothetical protein [Gammaproteobacteria bacterium]
MPFLFPDLKFYPQKPLQRLDLLSQQYDQLTGSPDYQEHLIAYFELKYALYLFALHPSMQFSKYPMLDLQGF